MKTKALFPNRYKRIGWILLVPSAILGVLILFFNVECRFLDSKVFTIYSRGILSSVPVIFGFFNGNYANTVVGIVFLIGAILVAFSEEKE